MTDKNGNKKAVGAPRKKVSELRKSFSVSFDQATLKRMDKQRGMIPRSRFAEAAVIKHLKKSK